MTPRSSLRICIRHHNEVGNESSFTMEHRVNRKTRREKGAEERGRRRRSRVSAESKK